MLEDSCGSLCSICGQYRTCWLDARHSHSDAATLRHWLQHCELQGRLTYMLHGAIQEADRVLMRPSVLRSALVRHPHHPRIPSAPARSERGCSGSPPGPGLLSGHAHPRQRLLPRPAARLRPTQVRLAACLHVLCIEKLASLPQGAVVYRSARRSVGCRHHPLCPSALHVPSETVLSENGDLPATVMISPSLPASI